MTSATDRRSSSLALARTTYNCVSSRRRPLSLIETVSYQLLSSFRSPASYHLLFGDESIPKIPTLLSDVSFVFDLKNEQVDTLERTTYFFQTWTYSFFPVHRHLEYILAYATRSTVASAIAYCWGRLDVVYNVYNITIQQMSEDSRYDQFRYRSRPAGSVATLILDMADFSRFECSCYRKISQCEEAHHLLYQSKDRLLAMLNLLSRRLTLLYVSRSLRKDKSVELMPFRQHVSNEPHQLHSAGVTFVENIRSCPEDILRDWASLAPLESKQCVLSEWLHSPSALTNFCFPCRMIEGLRFISYGMPDACRLIQILELQATFGIT